MKKNIFLISIGLFLTISVFAQSKSKIIKRGANLTKVASDYSFTEGPAVDKMGNIYFTDQPNNRILKWSTNGSISTFMENAGRSNGLYFDHDGSLLSCADEKNELWKIGMNKKVEVLVKDFNGKRLNGPNDLWLAPNGGIYFTDPFYKRKWWAHTEKEIEKENVYYLAPDRKTLTMVATDFIRPNGIVGTKNGKSLYVVDINDKKTYRFTINPDGTLSDRQLFCEMGSDGMTLDKKGNLYLTNKEGVVVFNKKGEKIQTIPTGENWTANVVFGGKKKKTLFVTAMGSVYTMKMRVKGM